MVAVAVAVVVGVAVALVVAVAVGIAVAIAVVVAIAIGVEVVVVGVVADVAGNPAAACPIPTAGSFFLMASTPPIASKARSNPATASAIGQRGFLGNPVDPVCA